MAPSVPVLIGVVAALGLALQSKRPVAPKEIQQPFHGSYDEALQNAFDRNVPALFVAIVETEGETLDKDILEFRSSLFTQPDFVAVSPWVVFGVGANRAHELVELEVDRGGGVKDTLRVCSIYKTEGCVPHQKMFDALYREHNVEGELRSPATILMSPDRKVVKVWQLGHAPPWPELVAELKKVRTAAGEGLTEAQLVEVRGLMATGAREFDQKRWGAGFLTWGKVTAVTSKSRYADEARQKQAHALEVLEQERVEIRQWIGEGKVVDGYVRLVKLREVWSGTAHEKELAKEIVALERGKDTKDVIAAHKREVDAEELWREARDLESAKDMKKAEAKLRLLLRKFGDTAAGRRARESYPELAADEDQRKSGGETP